MKKLNLFLSLLFLSAMLLFSCSENKTSNPNLNIPPETDVFVTSADTLNYTPSIQVLHWDGRDTDGFVTGFYYTWKENPGPADWEYTTERSLEFPLQITGQDTIYMFQVKAVDDDGEEDPTPAKQRFPIKNSPPVIKWTRLSQIPDTTFSVANFLWEASDVDGDSTITRFEYALDDTTVWRNTAGYNRDVTLNADSGLTTGEHAFYIRAVDIAGARSNTIRMPENPAKNWYVKAPAGRYLLVDDFTDESSSGFPDAYYRTMMQNVVVPQGENFSYWNIEKLFPASKAQFSETLKLFDFVVWYTDISQQTDEHFITAQLAIPEFLASGGRIVYTTMFDQGFGSQGDPLAFSPVASLSPPSGVYRSFPGSVYHPDSSFYDVFPALQLPELKVSFFIPAMKALTPKANAISLYRSDAIPTEQSDDMPVFMVLGENDNSPGEYNFLFSGTPLHQLRGNNNLDQFFDVILNNVFK